MGRNLARNFARHDFAIALHNRTVARTEEVVKHFGQEGTFVPARTAQEFVASLERPRRIVIMVNAGPATDAVIDEFAPLLEAGDMLIDGGNAHFKDTRRREAKLRQQNIHFVGMGVSGGEEGALNGPSIMPGGSAESYRDLGPMLETIAAEVDGTPCCTHVGPDGAGHFVKMVHNGIEYADMQLIAEAYDLLRHGWRLRAKPDSRDLQDLEHRPPRLLPHRDHRRGPRAHRRAPPASRSSTSCSTRPNKKAPAAGPSRTLSTWACRSAASPRRSSPARCPATPTCARPPVRCPAQTNTRAGRRVRRQGRTGPVRLQAGLLRAGLEHDGSRQPRVRLGHRPGRIAIIWRGGCIIRAAFLDRIRAAYANNPDLPTLLVDEEFAKDLAAAQDAWRNVVATAARLGIPVPGFSAALAYYDALRAERLPAALIQGLRDFFGAHTYRRTDRDGTFHTLWAEGRSEEAR